MNAMVLTQLIFKKCASASYHYDQVLAHIVGTVGGNIFSKTKKYNATYRPTQNNFWGSAICSETLEL